MAATNAKLIDVTSEMVGRYNLLGKMAAGGMAEVFLARQSGPEGFSKIVVVKRILPHLSEDPHFIEMFLNEARLAARLNHTNVVSIYELGRDPTSGAYFMAMEYIDGCTMKRFAHAANNDGRPLVPEICARLIVDACSGLEYAHNLKDEKQRPLNIVHRDISPENILVTYQEGNVKVLDFGIAKSAMVESRTAIGQVKGKFAYMPPEQLRGEALDRRADVWGLGVTLYWLLAGLKPFAGTNQGTLVNQILNAEPKPVNEVNPNVPEALATIVHRALTKDLGARTPSCAALQDELEGWMQAEHRVVGRAAISRLMSQFFPEDRDPERAARRAILNGALDQNTPSNTDYRRLDVDIYEATVSQIRARRGRRYRWIAMAGAATLGVAITVTALAHHRRTIADIQTQPVALSPPPPPAPLPSSDPQPPPPAVDQPVVPRTTLAVAPTMAPTPTAIVTPPLPFEAPALAPARAHPVRRHQSTQTAPDRAGPGSIAVRVSPWATVFVDGEEVGTTPFAPLTIEPGIHRVMLKNDELSVTKTMTVRVQSGQTATVHMSLE